MASVPPLEKYKDFLPTAPDISVEVRSYARKQLEKVYEAKMWKDKARLREFLENLNNEMIGIPKREKKKIEFLPPPPPDAAGGVFKASHNLSNAHSIPQIHSVPPAPSSGALEKMRRLRESFEKELRLPSASPAPPVYYPYPHAPPPQPFPPVHPDLYPRSSLPQQGQPASNYNLDSHDDYPVEDRDGKRSHADPPSSSASSAQARGSSSRRPQPTPPSAAAAAPEMTAGAAAQPEEGQGEDEQDDEEEEHEDEASQQSDYRHQQQQQHQQHTSSVPDGSAQADPCPPPQRSSSPHVPRDAPAPAIAPPSSPQPPPPPSSPARSARQPVAGLAIQQQQRRAALEEEVDLSGSWSRPQVLPQPDQQPLLSPSPQTSIHIHNHLPAYPAAFPSFAPPAVPAPAYGAQKQQHQQQVLSPAMYAAYPAPAFPFALPATSSAQPRHLSNGYDSIRDSVDLSGLSLQRIRELMGK